MARLNMKIIAAVALAALSAAATTACTQDAHAMDAQQIEKQYGVSGAYAETINTSDGRPDYTGGRPSTPVRPQRQASDLQTVYSRRARAAVKLGDNVSRDS